MSLSVVYSPDTDVFEPVLDIVAIQGFAPYERRELEHEAAIGDHYWVRDQLPLDFPEARIMTFQYDSIYTFTKSPEALSQQVTLFLDELQDSRRTAGAADRSIVFLAHSVGGVLVDQALRAMSNIDNSILHNICGVVYFNTPHAYGYSAKQYFQVFSSQLRMEFGASRPPPSAGLEAVCSQIFNDYYRALIAGKTPGDATRLPVLSVKTESFKSSFMSIYPLSSQSSNFAPLGTVNEEVLFADYNRDGSVSIHSRMELTYQIVVHTIHQMIYGSKLVPITRLVDIYVKRVGSQRQLKHRNHEGIVEDPPWLLLMGRKIPEHFARTRFEAVRFITFVFSSNEAFAVLLAKLRKRYAPEDIVMSFKDLLKALASIVEQSPSLFNSDQCHIAQRFQDEDLRCMTMQLLYLELMIQQVGVAGTKEIFQDVLANFGITESRSSKEARSVPASSIVARDFSRTDRFPLTIDRDELKSLGELLAKLHISIDDGPELKLVVEPSSRVEIIALELDIRDDKLSKIEERLMRSFEHLSVMQYSWLQELKDAGYTVQEMAELLVSLRDSPWICFTPDLIEGLCPKSDHHLKNCAHTMNDIHPPPAAEIVEFAGLSTAASQNGARHKIEGLLGLAGVAPTSRIRDAWLGNVIFKEEAAVITYLDPIHRGYYPTRESIIYRISECLALFEEATAIAQEHGLCCNCFTILVDASDSVPRSDISSTADTGVVKCQRIEFVVASKLRETLSQLSRDLSSASYSACEAAADQVLGVFHTANHWSSDDPPSSLDSVIHKCALAAQTLSLGFLSYLQAHVGSIDPFFLDKPQENLFLHGSRQTYQPYVVARLVELTCLGEMLGRNVLVFRHSSFSPVFQSPCDVLCSTEDLLDTWGPGQFITNATEPPEVVGIKLGGGYITAQSSDRTKFHWSSADPFNTPLLPFDRKDQICIGTRASVNTRCQLNENVYRVNCENILHELGTSTPYWATNGRTTGITAGQYLVGSFTQTYAKIPGKTLKEVRLEGSSWLLIDFLDQVWGLQVSLCTRVARRVVLRKLMQDLMSRFVNPQQSKLWTKLETDHQIINVFRDKNIWQWLISLPDDLQTYVLQLIGDILSHLSITGIDAQRENLVVAWPIEGDISRCLKIPCKAESFWTHVLADSEDCATFAYVTPECLEAGKIKCQGSIPQWRNSSELLSTAVRSDAGMSLTNWCLVIGQTYFIKKFDRRLQLRAEAVPETDGTEVQLLVSTSRIPPDIFKRMLVNAEQRQRNQIREKRVPNDHGELVIVRSSG